VIAKMIRVQQAIAALDVEWSHLVDDYPDINPVEPIAIKKARTAFTDFGDLVTDLWRWVLTGEANSRNTM
jgi:hypothetical protein